MEELRLRPGKCYRLSAGRVVLVVCGVFLHRIDTGVWIIESKVKPSTEAKPEWKLDYLNQDSFYLAEEITLREWKNSPP